MSGRQVRAGQTKVILLTQVYPPDPASTGQHFADAAAELVRRGHRVVIYTANRGYDDPSRRYPSRETYAGVEVRRLPLSSFGKRTVVIRLLGAISFIMQCFVVSLLTRKLSGVIVGTTPPMIAVIAILAGRLRNVPVAYWVMDLNPDQLIALGRLGPRSMAARALERLNRFALGNARLVIALDDFMAARLAHKTEIRDRLAIIPPWPHEQHLEPVAHALNPFRAEHGLDGKFVVMYSGNHSPSNPLTTLLDATVRLRDVDRLRFVFVGGGLLKAQVERYVSRFGLDNVVSLPYQPLARLRYSLSAADVHVVSLGDAMVGIIHPCKIYGAMAVARPILYFGPRPSHIARILDESAIGVTVSHGDTNAAVKAIRDLMNLDPAQLKEMGLRGRNTLREAFSQAALCAQFCDRIEGAFAIASAPAPRPTESVLVEH